eukprot:765397-Hanusia_phi.AAC.1
MLLPSSETCSLVTTKTRSSLCRHLPNSIRKLHMPLSKVRAVRSLENEREVREGEERSKRQGEREGGRKKEDREKGEETGSKEEEGGRREEEERGGRRRVQDGGWREKMVEEAPERRSWGDARKEGRVEGGGDSVCSGETRRGDQKTRENVTGCGRGGVRCAKFLTCITRSQQCRRSQVVGVTLKMMGSWRRR